MTALQLDGKFGIAGALRFEETPGGLVRAVVSTPAVEGDIYLQGAHVAHWTPRGEKPVLFMSRHSAFLQGKAIRGGVPIIFPWFGARADGKPGPSHGFARTMAWSMESARLREHGALELTFGMAVEEFEVGLVVLMGRELEMSLEVRNDGGAEARFEEALHTYLAVGDVRQVSVNGLEETAYIDKTDGFQQKTQGSEPVRIGKETDSVYLDTKTACEVVDPVWERRISIEKTGSSSTVVWNPWVEKTAAMADMGADEWQGMICVETANASENAVVLEGGGVHRMTARIAVSAA